MDNSTDSVESSLSERVFNLHRDSFVVDCHNDTIVAHLRRGYLNLFDDIGADGEPQDARNVAYRLMSGAEPVGTIGLMRGPEYRRSGEATVQIDVPKMAKGGIDLGCFAIDVTLALKNHLAYAADGFGWFLDQMEQNPDGLMLVRTAADLGRAEEAEKPAALLAIEHADGVEGSLHVLRSLYEIGVRAIGLTHNRSSLAADGCAESREGVGLTPFGVLLVREMNRLGMVVDLAHVSPSGFYDALRVSERPVIFSHGNAKALCDHSRNLDDRQLEALAKSDGVIGVSFVPDFIDPVEPTLDRLLDHIDHIRSVSGVRSIGIGSDFDGGGTLFRDATHYPQITSGLVDRGYSDDDVRSILGGNVKRLLDSVLV